MREKKRAEEGVHERPLIARASARLVESAAQDPQGLLQALNLFAARLLAEAEVLEDEVARRVQVGDGRRDLLHVVFGVLKVHVSLEDASALSKFNCWRLLKLIQIK